jgi:hypothetical protein
MKTSSAKQKGRLLQQLVAKTFAEHYNMVYGPDQDFASRPMGGSGVDVAMSPGARTVCPYDVECKAQEAVNIWSAFDQAQKNTKQDRVPLLVIKRNRSEVLAVLKLSDLLKVMKR